MSSMSALERNTDPGLLTEPAARETAPVRREARASLDAHILMTDNLVAALEMAGVSGEWYEAARLAGRVAESAAALDLRTMSFVVEEFAAAVQQGAEPHALRNMAQMIVVEHEHLRMVLGPFWPRRMA